MSEITVKEVKEKKHALENDILELLNSFSLETGISVGYIYLERVDAGDFINSTAKKLVNLVEITLESL